MPSLEAMLDCAGRAHCRDCRTNRPFISPIAGRFGLAWNFPCPHGVTAEALPPLQLTARKKTRPHIRFFGGTPLCRRCGGREFDVTACSVCKTRADRYVCRGCSAVALRKSA